MTDSEGHIQSGDGYPLEVQIKGYYDWHSLLGSPIIWHSHSVIGVVNVGIHSYSQTISGVIGY